jgi:hypothetical protein
MKFEKKITQSIAIAARKHTQKEQIVERKKSKKKLLSSLWRVEVALLLSMLFRRGGKVESGM